MSQNSFWRIFPWEKSRQISVLEAGSSRQRHDSTGFLEKVIFQKFEQTAPRKPKYLAHADRQNPRSGTNIFNTKLPSYK
jgi:hypothetical protein